MAGRHRLVSPPAPIRQWFGQRALPNRLPVPARAARIARNRAPAVSFGRRSLYDDARRSSILMRATKVKLRSKGRVDAISM